MMIIDKTNIDDYSLWLSKAQTEGAVALIDKDKDWTSFDVVAKLRGLTKIKKVGHAGTLDPLATGLLILAFGRATKTLSSYQGMEKEYEGVIRLGATTKTDDSEADEENIVDVSNLDDGQIESACLSFTGKIMQKAPLYSAKKINGRKLYALARKNIDIEPPTSEVEIYKFDIIGIDLPLVSFKVRCSKGTYIRSLARDIGEKLGVGGYLANLRRSAIGNYEVKTALKINDIVAKRKSLDSDRVI